MVVAIFMPHPVFEKHFRIFFSYDIATLGTAFSNDEAIQNFNEISTNNMPSHHSKIKFREYSYL